MTKREKIALYEYDPNREAVIMPNHEHLNIKLPKIAVFAFVGETLDVYAREHNLPVVAEFKSITKKYPIYVAQRNDKRICLCQAPCGAAPATQILDWLIGYGVKYVVATGSCGVLRDITENSFLIPIKALRDEGTSFHYLPPGRYVDLNAEMVDLIWGHFIKRGINCQKVTTWTTDGFYRETKQKVTERLSEGCSVVEMECAALAACAEFRGINFGQFFFTADSLSSVDDYRERGFGEKSLMPALLLSIEIAAAINLQT